MRVCSGLTRTYCPGYVWPTCKNVSRHAKKAVRDAKKPLENAGVRRTCRIGGPTCKKREPTCRLGRDAEKLSEIQRCGGRVGLAARHARNVSQHAGLAARDAKTSCLEPNGNEIINGKIVK